MKLELNKIRVDGGTQSRAILQRNVINEYAELMASEIEMPPVDIFYDGENYWLANGFHRFYAKKQISENNDEGFLPEETINTTIHQGTQRDAILFSLGANADHGIRRNNDDKNRAVETMLRDNEWQNWSDREIAKICKVSNTFVSELRKKFNSATVNIDSKTYKRNGKVQTMKTKKIGKHHVTKEKEIIDTETGELLVKSEKTLAVQTELEKCPNTKEIFESNQFKEDVKQELENSHPELAERFDQDVELPSYNVISEELTYKEKSLKIIAEEVANKMGLEFKWEHINLFTFEIYELLQKQLEKANQKIAALEETNNQLFSANENLTKELKEANQKVAALENELNDVGFINNNTIELEKNNKNLEDRIYTLIKENETLKEANGRLKLVVKPSNSNQSDEMLVKIQSIFETSLEKGKEKREGIRIGRTNSIELLTAIKQTLGVE
jgi:hypothetical protein